MPRTVVPPVFLRGAKVAEGGDDFPDKLLKYVPAETLAFFVPVTAGLDSDKSGWLVVVLVAGAIGTFGYLWIAGQREPDDKKPLPYLYALAVIAFLCWAVGTSKSVADLVNVGSVGAGIILGLAVFLIPLLDQLSIEFEKWRRSRSQT